MHNAECEKLEEEKYIYRAEPPADLAAAAARHSSCNTHTVNAAAAAAVAGGKRI